MLPPLVTTMLPDFPSLKQDLSRKLAKSAQAVAEGAPLLRDIHTFRQNEGAQTNMSRADGSESTIDYASPVSAEIVITIDEMRRHGAQASARAVQQIGSQLEEGMTKMMFASLSQAADEVGNTVDAKGRPFSMDVIIECLEKMDFSFTDDGVWEPPTFVVHPDTYEKIAVQLDAQEKDPASKARLDDIVARKREVWSAREASRTLAD